MQLGKTVRPYIYIYIFIYLWHENCHLCSPQKITVVDGGISTDLLM